jgi:outer membrane protein assembly factor BamB
MLWVLPRFLCGVGCGLGLLAADNSTAWLRAANETQTQAQAQWGEAWSRNMISSERGLVSEFDLKSRQNIRWSVPLGTETHSTPMVANGRIYIGTNNGQPRDPRHEGDRGVLMCFNEADGRLLWQLWFRNAKKIHSTDWPKTGISSPVTVGRGPCVFGE